jgi:hypothetical protein
MRTETYLNKFRNGSILEKLENLRKEYSGPCGQSATVMTANDLKVKILKDSMQLINVLLNKLIDNKEVYIENEEYFWANGEKINF